MNSLQVFLIKYIVKPINLRHWQETIIIQVENNCQNLIHGYMQTISGSFKVSTTI